MKGVTASFRNSGCTIWTNYQSSVVFQK